MYYRRIFQRGFLTGKQNTNGLILLVVQWMWQIFRRLNNLILKNFLWVKNHLFTVILQARCYVLSSYRRTLTHFAGTTLWYKVLFHARLKVTGTNQPYIFCCTDIPDCLYDFVKMIYHFAHEFNLWVLKRQLWLKITEIMN